MKSGTERGPKRVMLELLKRLATSFECWLLLPLLYSRRGSFHSMEPEQSPKSGAIVDFSLLPLDSIELKVLVKSAVSTSFQVRRKLRSSLAYSAKTWWKNTPRSSGP